MGHIEHEHTEELKSMIPVAELAAYRNIPVFSWTSNSNKLDNKRAYSTLIRALPPVSSLGGLFVAVFYGFNWTRAVMISTREEQQSDLADSIETIFEYYSIFGFKLVRHYSANEQVVDEDTIRTIYTSVKREARIVILVVPQSELRKYMLVAEEMQMVDGAYQFLFTRSDILDEDELRCIQSTRLWQNGDGRDSQAREAFQNLLFIALGGTDGNFSSFKQQTFQAMAKDPWLSALPGPTQPDEYSPFLYDAVTLYCLALNASLKNGGTPSGESIKSQALTVRFKGKTGDFTLSPASDRQPIFWIFDLGTEGNFNLVVSIAYTLKNGTVSQIGDIRGEIRWGDGGIYSATSSYVPSDIPACGFEEELCPPGTGESLVASVIPAIFGALFAFTGIVLIMVYRWVRFERELANMIWKIQYGDLKFIGCRRGRPVVGSIHTGLPSQSLTSLVSRTESGDKELVTSVIGSLAMSVSGGGSLSGAQMFITVASLRGNPVAVKIVRKQKIKVDRVLQKEMKAMLELKHGNLTTFVGVCVESPHICALWEYCSKGSLQDVIENENIKLDAMFKLSLAADICKGIDYIHKSTIQIHGNLKSSNCVIDNRWSCKLTDFGLTIFKQGEEQDPEQAAAHAHYARLFWTAPETLRVLLRSTSHQVIGSQQGDIYSFGIVAKELLCRNGPYAEESHHLSPKEIIDRIVHFNTIPQFRPSISKDMTLSESGSNTAGRVINLVHQCWSEVPELRPSIKAVMRKLNTINPYKKTNVLDNMITLMDKYSSQLEDLVSDRTQQLEEEKKKTDTLLYRMLPKSVAENLKLGRSVEAETFEDVTIYFSDIVGFTNIAGQSTPMQVVGLLNSLYTIFDDIVSKYDVYKVETIGDAYMIVSGLPVRNGAAHVKEIADVSLDILSAVSDFTIPHETDKNLQIRIGLHSGSAVAGVVGLTMPRYCLFGDTVNTASRMESNGKASRIHMSGRTHAALAAYPEYYTQERGEIEIKGKGKMVTYWLVGKDGYRGKLPGEIAPVEEGENKTTELRQYHDSSLAENRISTLWQRHQEDGIAAVEIPEAIIKLPHWTTQPVRKSLVPLNGISRAVVNDNPVTGRIQSCRGRMKSTSREHSDMDRSSTVDYDESHNVQHSPIVHIPGLASAEEC